ncbi:uncharacterized protein K452DRAFT_273014 [Neofusicoccum parvum]|uniref:Uncharacterized protein K452DRAFT_273014 n=1 Tax=Neofusicoccum parvum TaxID=310453 RepID=A0ACB5SGW7_9PEZI|nr:uncharacterized protein K452DRAFT_273014 [Neofusicoccum parvum]
MTSRWFNPTQDFVESRAKEADVRNYIVSSNFINKVYMIMGVMIASEATIAKTSADNKGGAVNVGVDATSLGLPLSVGAKNELQNEHQIEIESASMDDFVFAYRLKELKIKNNGKVVQRPFKKGALLDGNRLDDEYEQMVKEKKEEEEAARIKVEGLNGSDVSGTEFGMRVKQTFSEGSEEECFVVIG